MKLRLAAIGDLHLGSPRLRRLLDDADELCLRVVRRILHEAKHEDVEHVVLLGDVFDGWPSPETVRRLLELFLEFEDSGLTFHVIPGNHDVRRSAAQEGYRLGSTTLDLFKTLEEGGKLKHVKVYLAPTAVRLNRVTVQFLPWPFKEEHFDNSLAIGHFGIKGALTDSGIRLSEKNDPWQPKPKRMGVLWLLGHLHQRQTLGDVLYPGTPYQTKFGENEDKSWCLLEVTQEKPSAPVKWAKVDVIPTKSDFVFVSLTAETQKELDEIAASVDARQNEPGLRRYRLRYDARKVTLPSGFLAARPEIVECEPSAGDANESSEFPRSLSSGFFDAEGGARLLDGLPEFLKAKGLVGKQVKQAVKIAKKAVDEVWRTNER